MQGTLWLLEQTQVPLSLQEWNARAHVQHERRRACKTLPGVEELLRNLIPVAEQASSVQSTPPSGLPTPAVASQLEKLPCI